MVNQDARSTGPNPQTDTSLFAPCRCLPPPSPAIACCLPATAACPITPPLACHHLLLVGHRLQPPISPRRRGHHLHSPPLQPSSDRPPLLQAASQRRPLPHCYLLPTTDATQATSHLHCKPPPSPPRTGYISASTSLLVGIMIEKPPPRHGHRPPQGPIFVAKPPAIISDLELSPYRLNHRYSSSSPAHRLENHRAHLHPLLLVDKPIWSSTPFLLHRRHLHGHRPSQHATPISSPRSTKNAATSSDPSSKS